MGRLFLVEFDRTNPEVNFYCCRFCQAHIALSEDCIGTVQREGFFSNVVNVITWPRGMDSLREDLYCVKCNMRLGWRHIQYSISPVVVPNVPNGSVFLKLDLLRFWNGILLRDAAALLPPVDNQEG